MRIRKRSSCDSGKGKVPWYSHGFWVAMTMKGCGNAWVMLSTDTWASFIASRRLLWVFGVVRLISSASTIWAKIGPGLNSKTWR